MSLVQCAICGKEVRMLKDHCRDKHGDGRVIMAQDFNWYPLAYLEERMRPEELAKFIGVEAPNGDR